MTLGWVRAAQDEGIKYVHATKKLNAVPFASSRVLNGVTGSRVERARDRAGAPPPNPSPHAGGRATRYVVRERRRLTGRRTQQRKGKFPESNGRTTHERTRVRQADSSELTAALLCGFNIVGGDVAVPLRVTGGHHRRTQASQVRHRVSHVKQSKAIRSARSRDKRSAPPVGYQLPTGGGSRRPTERAFIPQPPRHYPLWPLPRTLLSRARSLTRKKWEGTPRWSSSVRW